MVREILFVIRRSGFNLLPPILFLLALSFLVFSETTARSRQAPLLSEELREQAEQALQRGVRWLEKQQAADGGWHSETYGTLREGIGCSALIVATLNEVQGKSSSRDRGLEFLVGQVNAQGLLEAAGGDADHPIYATALLLQTLPDWEDARKERLIPRLGRALLSKQRLPRQGWPADDLQTGGWGAGVELLSDAPFINPANISVTRHVLAALKKTEQLSKETESQALLFVKNCQLQQAGDVWLGGFFFTPDPAHPLNKAGQRKLPDGSWRLMPYSSATSDGWLALSLLGKSQKAASMQAVVEVLTKLPHYRIPPAPGETPGSQTSLQAIYFYEAAASAEIARQLSPDVPQQRNVRLQQVNTLKNLLTLQSPEGFWENPVNVMFEDDPLIATPLAILAIHRLLQAAAE